MYIDIKTALSNLGNSVKLYRTLINGFIEKYDHIDNEIYELIIQRKIEDARRLAHSLKGLCGNVGTVELKLCAEALEKDLNQYIAKSISDEEVERIIESTWYEFSVMLGKVLPVLIDILKVQDEILLEAAQLNDISVVLNANATSKSGFVPKDMNEDVLKQLLKVINTYNYEHINELITSFEDELMIQLLGASWEQIKTLVTNYEYDEAKTVILKGMKDEN